MKGSYRNGTKKQECFFQKTMSKNMPIVSITMFKDKGIISNVAADTVGKGAQ